MRKIIIGLFVILLCFSIGISNFQEKELSEEEKSILKKAIEIIKKHKERELLELMREASKPKEKEKKLDIEEYKAQSWLNSFLGKTDADKLEEENDRLEGLLEELRNERSSLEWDMMRYRLSLENAKPDALDYQMALDSAIFSAMIAPNPLYDSWIYYYPGYSSLSSCGYLYPSYSTKTDRTNYEPLLFLLSTNSSGKMDWTKYGWLKLLLNKK